MYFLKDGIAGQTLLKKLDHDRFASIPFDADNRDYQEYLAWVAEGNEAEPWA